jgi:hypothetical protein
MGRCTEVTWSESLWMMKGEYFAATVTVLGGHRVRNTEIKNKFMHMLNIECKKL